MKPENWDQLDREYKLKWAIELAHSFRGMYLLGQALHYAIQELRKVDKPYKEQSNIEDMEILRELIFDIPFVEPRTSPDQPEISARVLEFWKKS